MGGAESRMADPPWRSKGNCFSGLAWLSGYAETIDQGCSVVLIALGAFVMNKLNGPHHQAIGFVISVIQSLRFTQAFFKKRITVKDKRLNIIHEFPHYVNGGGTIAMTYVLLAYFFPVVCQYQIFVSVGLLQAFSIIQFTEILLFMKRYRIFRFTAFLVMVSMMIQLFLRSQKDMAIINFMIPEILMVVGSCSLAILLCHEEITNRMNAFFHIGLCLLCVTWNVYSLFGVIRYGVLLLFGTFFIGNVQFPAVITLLALSFLSLLKKDEEFTWETYACYIFTIVEGIVYLTVCWLEQLFYTWFKFSLARELDMCHKDGLNALDGYYENAYKASKDKKSFESLSLQKYAIECLDSKQADMRLQGLTLLEALVVGHKDDKIVSEISCSSKAVTTIFSFLGSISINMKLLAAKIILAIDGHALQVVGARQGIATISSLLCVSPKSAKNRGTPRSRRSPQLLVDFFQYIRNPDKGLCEYKLDEDSLALMGMRILQKLLDHFEYVSETSNSRDLLNKVVAFMDISIMMEGQRISLMRSEEERMARMNELQMSMQMSSGMTELQRMRACRMREAFGDTNMDTLTRMNKVFDDQKKYINSSLNLILTLASFKSVTGNELRNRFFEIPSLLTNLYNILHNDNTNDWKRIGIDIVGNLALHERLNNEMGALFIPLIMPFVSNGIPSTEIIAQSALCNLSMINKNCKIIWGFQDFNLFKYMLRKLHMQDEDLDLYVVGNLLYNLFDGSKEIKNPKSWLPLVLKRAKNALRTDDELKTLETEAFIGLASKFFDIITNITFFDNTIEENLRELSPLLVKCLEKNIRPRTSQLRRVIIHMTISMLKSSWKVEMIDARMPQALSETHTTVMENYRLHFGDIGVIEMDMPISQLLLEAKQLC